MLHHKLLSTTQMISLYCLKIKSELQYVKEMLPNVAQRIHDINKCIQELMALATTGDSTKQLAPYPSWFQENKNIIAQWLTEDAISEENKLSLKIKLAETGEAIVAAINEYPGEFYSVLNSTYLPKQGITRAVMAFLNPDPSQEISPSFNWDGTHITRRYGIREQVVKIAQAQARCMNENQFKAAIMQATTYPQLEQLIRHFPGTIHTSDQRIADKNELADTVVSLLKNRTAIKKIGERTQSASRSPAATEAALWALIPRDFDIRKQVLTIADQLYQDLFSMQAQQLVKDIASCETIDALIELISSYPRTLVDSSNLPLNKNELITNLTLLSAHKTAPERLFVFITQSYGLRAKLKKLCQAPQRPEQIASQNKCPNTGGGIPIIFSKGTENLDPNNPLTSTAKKKSSSQPLPYAAKRACLKRNNSY